MGSVKVPLIPVLMWTAFVYLVFIVAAATPGVATNGTANPFLFVFRLATFTLVTGLPTLFAALLFITTTLPLLYVLFMPVLEYASIVTAGAASNSLGGQVVIVAGIVVLIGTIATLLFAFL